LVVGASGYVCQFGFAHALAGSPDKEVDVAEKLNWRAQKFV